MDAVRVVEAETVEAAEAQEPEKDVGACPYVNQCLSRFSYMGLSPQSLWVIKSLVLLAIALFVSLFGLYLFIMFYPFKTVVFTGTPPIRVMNTDKKVPIGGIVLMRMDYIKFVDDPGTVVRTLVRVTDDGQLEVLDSSTVASTWKRGAGLVESTFVVNDNPYFVSKRAMVIYSISYFLYGVRPVLVQYVSEEFEIIDNGASCPPTRARGYIPAPPGR